MNDTSFSVSLNAAIFALTLTDVAAITDDFVLLLISASAGVAAVASANTSDVADTSDDSGVVEIDAALFVAFLMPYRSGASPARSSGRISCFPRACAASRRAASVMRLARPRSAALGAVLFRKIDEE